MRDEGFLRETGSPVEKYISIMNIICYIAPVKKTDLVVKQTKLCLQAQSSYLPNTGAYTTYEHYEQ